jgi:1-acyl-sn-glycerol-3-phosphate acyltransferase
MTSTRGQGPTADAGKSADAPKAAEKAAEKPAADAPSKLPAGTDVYVDKPGPVWKMAQVLVRVWGSLWFDLKVFGIKNVPRTGGALIVSNHQSFLDPALLGGRLPRPMSYMAKSELFENPVLSWLIRSLGAFPVRQGAGDIRAIKETVHRLQEGRILNIFPEGSRTETGAIMPMEPGVALVVRKAGVPIVPAAIIGSYQAWPKGKRIFRRHPIRIVYGPPLDVKGMKADPIIRLIDAAIRELYAGLESGRMNDALAAKPLKLSQSERQDAKTPR